MKNGGPDEEARYCGDVDAGGGSSPPVCARIIGSIKAALLGYVAVYQRIYPARLGRTGRQTNAGWGAGKPMTRELVPGALDGAHGLVRATGRLLPARIEPHLVQPLPQAA